MRVCSHAIVIFITINPSFSAIVSPIDIVHEFGEIMQNKGHFAVKGHSRSPIFVPIESSYTNSYLNENSKILNSKIADYPNKLTESR